MKYRLCTDVKDHLSQFSVSDLSDLENHFQLKNEKVSFISSFGMYVWSHPRALNLSESADNHHLN